jgi:uncharacterized protein (TIGR00255 family)
VSSGAVTVTSMTGYARAEGRCDVAGLPAAFTWVWEAKSVNGKGLDIRVRVPAGFDSLEPVVRQAAGKGLSRGSLTLNLQVSSDTGGVALKVNEPLLDALLQLAVKKAAGLPAGALGALVAPARIDGLLALRGVLDASDSTPIESTALAARDAALLTGLTAALERLTGSRRDEGARLAPVVAGHLDEIDRLCAEARGLAATQPAALQAKVTQAVADLLGASSPVAPDRLAQEIALLALKADVREELDRLTAHVAQARELLAKGEPCGRKLDFLSQEFNREANTLCSKATDLALTRTGLGLKAAVDQFREQIQNIE